MKPYLDAQELDPNSTHRKVLMGCMYITDLLGPRTRAHLGPRSPASNETRTLLYDGVGFFLQSNVRFEKDRRIEV